MILRAEDNIGVIGIVFWGIALVFIVWAIGRVCGKTPE
jgi:hypothetical protein